ncbi:MAG: Hpt domain-containing protein [Lachnospiraceae bacterium]|nr:Hpt domain-containing protein [Lachnospiraceae bacterium]
MSMTNILQEMGCEMEETMERFMDDQEFYVECFHKFIEDKELENLGVIIESGNIDDSFTKAHTLKGTLGNLGLTPLYDQMVVIVEFLRKGDMQQASERYHLLMREWERYKYLQ